MSRRIQDITDSFQQLSLTYRLHKVRGNSKFPATSCIPQVSSRGQHHNGRTDQLWILLDPLSERKAIHVRHLSIQQDQTKRPPSALGDFKGLKRGPRSEERRVGKERR